jgi:hypothetical protein
MVRQMLFITDLLEPMHAFRQFGTVDAVTRPAAHDLADPPVEGAAAELVLDRAVQPAQVLPELSTRT